MNKERYWTFILYPESCPDNFKEILQKTGLCVAISPLHDKDINSDGELKKEHYHILLCFNGPTTYNKVKSITDELCGTIPQRVLSCKGIIRYFSHKDNPEKYQYNEQDIVTLNGLDLKSFNDLTLSQQLIIKKDIILLIQTENITSYNELVNRFLMNFNDRDYFQVVCSNTFFFNSYIKSRNEVFRNESLK